MELGWGELLVSEIKVFFFATNTRGGSRNRHENTYFKIWLLTLQCGIDVVFFPLVDENIGASSFFHNQIGGDKWYPSSWVLNSWRCSEDGAHDTGWNSATQNGQKSPLDTMEDGDWSSSKWDFTNQLELKQEFNGWHWD